MAPQVTGANVLSLEDHCRRRVDRHLEELLVEPYVDQDPVRQARAVAEAIDQEFHAHLEHVLAAWQEGRP